MTKPLSKKEKARRARQRRIDDSWDRALYALVKAGMLRALLVTYRDIQLGNSEMTDDEVLDLARDVVGADYVIYRAIDAAQSTMVEEELPSAAEAVRLVAEAAGKAALETFKLRHRLPAGRA